MNGILDKVKSWWQNADRSQRVMTIGGIAGLVLVLFATFSFASRPHYKILYTGLTDVEQGQTVKNLEAMGIEPQIESGGTLLVPSESVDKIRIDLAAQGKQPKTSGHWGIEKASTFSLGNPPDVQNMELNAITEGELATTIEAFEGVQAATVKIAQATSSPFTSEEKPSTASVMVTEAQSGAVDHQKAHTIALLVSNAVKGMAPKDVVISNQAGQTLWNGAEDGGSALSNPNNKVNTDKEVSNQQEGEIQALLDKTLGPNAAVVTVKADVDMDPTNVDDWKRSPSDKPLTAASQDEKMTGVAGVAGGLTGVQGQMNNAAPVAQNGNAASGKGYEGNNKQKEFLPNETHTTTTKATGSIKGMAINVVVDADRVPDTGPVEKAVRGIVANRIQLDANGQPIPAQPFTVTVTSLPFDKTAAKAAEAAAAAAASQARIQQLISLLPIGALLVVALMVVKQIGKFAKTYLPAPVTVTAEGVALPMPAELEGTQSDAPQLPEGSDAILAQLQESGAAHAGDGMSLADMIPALGIGDIADKVDIPLEQLRKMANEKPQIVAMLIKSLLLEDRR